ncbi:MAG: hypothetical protein ACI8T1_002750 [Verrucomicrobiales bacterium]|jgi:uncharacterized protein (DUF1800 family)
MSDPLAPYPPDSSEHAWTRREATHLLWRVASGASHDDISRVVDDGLVKTLDRLLSPQSETEEFLTTERLLHRTAMASGNIDALKHWWLYRMLYSANPLAEKMTLFWHNHFATSNAKVRSTEKMEVQNALIRKHALGSFQRLLQDMARDVAMLVWLDGNANRKRHPNENFAREVMELFSLGVGNYTETDIQEAARAFTGWHVREDAFWFNNNQHDPSTKTVLAKSGPFKGDDILKLCLEQPACARHLAKKLLRVFVQPNPDSALIDALAASIRRHDFEMRPVLRELFASRAFFAPAARHALIKSPADLIVSAFKAFGGQCHLAHSAQLMSDLGQNLFEPPTVKGWEGDRQWINSATMLQRASFAAEFAGGKRYGQPGALSQKFDSSSDTVAHWVALLLNDHVSSAATQELVTYTKKAGPSAEARRSLVQLFLTMPEYQLL